MCLFWETTVEGIINMSFTTCTIHSAYSNPMVAIAVKDLNIVGSPSINRWWCQSRVLGCANWVFKAAWKVSICRSFNSCPSVSKLTFHVESVWCRLPSTKFHSGLAVCFVSRVFFSFLLELRSQQILFYFSLAVSLFYKSLRPLQ